MIASTASSEQQFSGRGLRIARADEPGRVVVRVEGELELATVMLVRREFERAYATTADKVRSRVYNIGTGVGVTLRDFEHIIRKHIPQAKMEIGGGLNFYGFAYPATGVYDISRAREELGWAPQRRADETFRELLDGLRDGAGADTPPLSPHTGGRLRSREIATGVGERQ